MSVLEIDTRVCEGKTNQILWGIEPSARDTVPEVMGEQVLLGCLKDGGMIPFFPSSLGLDSEHQPCPRYLLQSTC